MALIEVLRSKFGSGQSLHMMDDSEGRHFCMDCRKLIRVGERFLESWMPEPFRRTTKTSYQHEVCPQ